MVAVEVTLNEWLYKAILAREVLTLNRDYFRLDGGLERRIYELARKHCGSQAEMDHRNRSSAQKERFSRSLKRFRELLKRIASSDSLPDYRMIYDPSGNKVSFYTKDAKKLTHENELMRERDLSKKGNAGRQREYAKRTARRLAEHSPRRGYRKFGDIAQNAHCGHSAVVMPVDRSRPVGGSGKTSNRLDGLEHEAGVGCPGWKENSVQTKAL
jgi:Replication initiator protein A